MYPFLSPLLQILKYTALWRIVKTEEIFPKCGKKVNVPNIRIQFAPFTDNEWYERSLKEFSPTS